jgi:2',3'-cyclic-nucleotide 2'-phosphodiesterase (5'-nucleotidase family)
MARFTALLAALLLMLVTGGYAQDQPDVEVLKLGIIHTNDTHGHLLPYRANGEDDWDGVARRRVAIQRARADTSYYWLVLDAGDVFQGTPLSNLLTGFLDIECMNQMGYDAMCLGNHEFDFGYDLLRGRISDANFHVLCANVIDRERGTPVAEPYTIIRRGDYRIGIIGLTTETLLSETHPSNAKSVSALPATPVCSSMAKYLRAIGCDIVIALGHQGYNRDMAMAAEVPELDVVVGGHTHTFLDEPMLVGDVVVTQNGQWSENLGILKLTFERPVGDPAARFELVSLENEYKPMAGVEPKDDGMEAFIADYQRRFDAEMGKVVCEAAHDFPVEDIRLAENALADVICDAMRGATDSDCVLFNGGNFRAPLFEGPVTFGDLYSVLPYDNFMMRVPVSGEKLIQCLEYAGLQYGDGGFPQVSGLMLHYEDMLLTEALIAAGEDDADWVPIDPEAEYLMLVTDFLAIGGDGFPLNEDPYGPGYTGLEQRATFALWASQQRVLEGATDGRVVFDWVNMTNPGLAD